MLDIQNIKNIKDILNIGNGLNMQDIKKRLNKIQKSINDKDKPIIIWIEKIKDKWQIKEQYLNRNRTSFKVYYLSDYASYLLNTNQDINIIIDDI